MTMPFLQRSRDYDCAIGAVSHNAYAAMGSEDFRRLLNAGGLFANIRGL